MALVWLLFCGLMLSGVEKGLEEAGPMWRTGPEVPWAQTDYFHFIFLSLKCCIVLMAIVCLLFLWINSEWRLGRT